MFRNRFLKRLSSMDSRSRSILFASIRELDELIKECWQSAQKITAERLSLVLDERLDRYDRSFDTGHGDS